MRPKILLQINNEDGFLTIILLTPSECQVTLKSWSKRSSSKAKSLMVLTSSPSKSKHLPHAWSVLVLYPDSPHQNATLLFFLSLSLSYPLLKTTSIQQVAFTDQSHGRVGIVSVRGGRVRDRWDETRRVEGVKGHSEGKGAGERGKMPVRDNGGGEG